jgi:glycosyltransferase involved in cell wall biosynthesis
MRVGLVTGRLAGGGAEVVVRRRAEGLGSAGHDVFVLSYSPMEENEPIQGAELRCLHAPRKQDRWLRLVPWIRRTAEQERLDVLLADQTFSNLVTLAAFAGRDTRPKIFVCEQNVISVLLRNEGMMHKIQLALVARLYRRADGVIAISHPVAADLVATCRLDVDRLWIVPNPLIDDTARNQQEARTRALAPGAGLTVAFAGRLVSQKRPERFVATLYVLTRRGYHVRGVILGDGDLRPQLEQQAQRLGVRCEFLGWQTDWRAFAQDADCLLLPSDVEGLANVLVEAAEVGLPAVAPSQALGVADAIVPGITGVFALSSRPDDLADGVLSAVALGHGDRSVHDWLAWFGRERGAGALARAFSAT